jgi:DNA-binding response OmpR family regulator/tetratricopeptide (TPR) repeat protein
MPVRVLLAEDNASLARMLRSFLASQKLEVRVAASGTEALKTLAAFPVDILVLDLRLPELSGVEVLQRLRRTPQGAHLPVIIITGAYKDDRYVAAARKLGVKHYLYKPFSSEAFLQAIRATMAELPPAADKPLLLDLLAQLYITRKSGLLTIGTASPITVVRGEPCSFQAQGKGDFPAFLVARGKLSAAEGKQFVDSGEERIFLTQAGFLTYEELAEESRLFLSRTIVDSLELREGIRFSEGFHPPELPLVPLCTPPLIYEAVKSHAARFDAAPFLGEYAGRYPARTRLFYRYANLTIMRQEDIDLLGAIDGRSALSDVIAKAANRNEAVAFLRYLVVLGMLRLHDDPVEEAVADFAQKTFFNRPLEELKSEDAVSIGFDDLVDELSDSVELAVGDVGMAAPLSQDEISFEQTVQRDYTFIKNKNYYELFGISPAGFSFNALKDAYFAKTRQFSPERFMELSGAMQEMAQEILSVYAGAYNTLSNVVAKERYDEMLNANTVGLAGKQDDKLQARIQFQSGKVFLEMGEFDNAEKAMLDAFTLESDSAQHCAFYAWVIYRNPANRNSRAALEKARNLLSKSLQMEKTAEAYAFRGWMLLDEGRDGLAEGEFQKALKLNANEANARKGLRLIMEKREAQNKGFLRKIFG